MKKIYIRGGAKEESGVKVMQTHLEEYGHKVVRSKQEDYDCILCWGCSTRDAYVKNVPALNANVNIFNKFEAMLLFDEAGLKIPKLISPAVALMSHKLFELSKPWFARNFHHEKGLDIELCEKFSQVQTIVEEGKKEFFSVYVPHTMELRLWVYKEKVFAAYEKKYKNPSVMNFKTMEYRSEKRDDLLMMSQMCFQAVKAVKTLKMDFGAVDVLVHPTNGTYILEVNSMPDISSLERVSGIRLAKSVHDWAEAL